MVTSQQSHCFQGSAELRAFIVESEGHRSLQEGERCLGRCPPRMFGGDSPTHRWQGFVGDGDREPHHLLPHQLTVGVPAGVEAMSHVTRHWREDNANDNAKVLINYDEGYANNEVDRHTFLVRMREVALGLCKWLEFIYPTDVATHVFYRGRVIPSAAGSQQGFPLIGACHALVKRMVHESLGLVAPRAGSQIQLPRIDPPIILDIAPTFADDGVIAGDEPEVLRAIQHMKKVMPLVVLRFSMMQVVAAEAGSQDPERFRAFRDEGCIMALDGNLEVLKSPIGDDTHFVGHFAPVSLRNKGKCQNFCQDSAIHRSRIFWQSGASMAVVWIFLARTTPPEFTQMAACDFDTAVVDTIGATCNVVLSDMQRTRAGFSTKEGGLGLRTIANKTQAAYIASRNATHNLCTRIRHSHRGDQNSRDQHLHSVIDALDIMVPGLDVAAMEPDDITQSVLDKRVNAQNMTNWRSEASPPERVHLQAYSAKGPRRLTLIYHQVNSWTLCPDAWDSTSWMAAGRVATVVNIWMLRGHTACHAWLLGMLRRSTMRFGTSASISANALGWDRSARHGTFFTTSSLAMVVAGLLTFCVSQLWLLPVFCPLEPERFARSQSVWT